MRGEHAAPAARAAHRASRPALTRVSRPAQEREALFEMVEKRPDAMWRTSTMYSFRNEAKVYGSPMLDAAWARAMPSALPDPIPALLRALRAVPPVRGGNARSAAAAGETDGNGAPRNRKSQARAPAAAAAAPAGDPGFEGLGLGAGADGGALLFEDPAAVAAERGLHPDALQGSGAVGWPAGAEELEGGAQRQGYAPKRRRKPAAWAEEGFLAEEEF